MKIARETKKHRREIKNWAQIFGEKRKPVPRIAKSSSPTSRTILEILKQKSGVHAYYNTDDLRSRDAKWSPPSYLHHEIHDFYIIKNYMPMFRFARVLTAREDFRSEAVSRELRELVLTSSSLSIPTIHRWRARDVLFLSAYINR